MLLQEPTAKGDVVLPDAFTPAAWTHKRRARAATASPQPDDADVWRAPPPLVCPNCNARLTHLRTHLGGVSRRQPEQWDDFTCHGCNAAFEYRTRTAKLRRME
jgi:hypothetical protein